MRRCKTCGANLDHRPRAQFCDGTCRVRYARGQRAATVVEFPATPPVSEVDGLLTLEDVARELQQALRSTATPPTAKAALAREYRATLEEIERAKPPVKDEVDELFARRVQRTGA